MDLRKCSPEILVTLELSPEGYRTSLMQDLHTKRTAYAEACGYGGIPGRCKRFDLVQLKSVRGVFEAYLHGLGLTSVQQNLDFIPREWREGGIRLGYVLGTFFWKLYEI